MPDPGGPAAVQEREFDLEPPDNERLANLCGPLDENLRPVDMVGDSAGSSGCTRVAALRAFRHAPTPITVPPVPTPETIKSTLPPVSVQISSAVVL